MVTHCWVPTSHCGPLSARAVRSSEFHSEADSYTKVQKCNAIHENTILQTHDGLRKSSGRWVTIVLVPCTRLGSQAFVILSYDSENGRRETCTNALRTMSRDLDYYRFGWLAPCHGQLLCQQLSKALRMRTWEGFNTANRPFGGSNKTEHCNGT